MLCQVKFSKNYSRENSVESLNENGDESSNKYSEKREYVLKSVFLDYKCDHQDEASEDDRWRYKMNKKLSRLETHHLVRFPGKGQVASEGFRNAQWMEGQLIMVGDYFSFAWIPISHQIFFGRPSPDLTLEMLTSSGSVNSDANVDDMKDFAMRCLEETAVMQEEEECPLHHNALGFYYENQDGCFE